MCILGMALVSFNGINIRIYLLGKNISALCVTVISYRKINNIKLSQAIWSLHQFSYWMNYVYIRNKKTSIFWDPKRWYNRLWCLNNGINNMLSTVDSYCLYFCKHFSAKEKYFFLQPLKIQQYEVARIQETSWHENS